jgi:hypothetical protein
MNNGILHILEVEVIRDFVLKIEFNDGTVKVVDVKPLSTDRGLDEWSQSGA